MRIALVVIVVICGANLLIELLDSTMVDVIKERNETIQRQIDQMWQSGNWPNIGETPSQITPDRLELIQDKQRSPTAWHSFKDSSHRVTFLILKTLMTVMSKPILKVFYIFIRVQKTTENGTM